MKIIFSTYGLSSGGAERVLSIISSEMASCGDEIILVLDKKKNNEYDVSNKIKKIYLSEKDKKNGIILTLKKIFKFRKIVKKEKPDFVISFLSIIPSFFATLFNKTRYVSTMRNDPNAYVKCKWLRDFCINHSYKLIIQNEEQIKYFKKKTREKTFVMYNPINDSFFNINYQFSGSICKIYTAGRLVEQKNHKMLIEAIINIHKIHPDISLDIYGDGPLHDDLLNLIVKNNAKDYITLKGNCSNICNAMKEYDLFVLPSLYEGMPNALMEAMACGIPCVSTDCPTGPKSLLCDDKNGVLVKSNDLTDLIQKLTYCIDNPTIFYERTRNAKEFIMNNCNKKIIIHKLKEILV